MEFLHVFINILLIAAVFIQNENHKQEIFDIYEQQNEEREKLLDRIMANNIHEFKAASGQVDVKRSPNGNFLVDRMEKSIKQQYSEDWE